MQWAKRVRRGVSGMLLTALLFAQIASAAYVCRVGASAPADSAAAMAGLPCAEMRAGAVEADPADPALCAHHCRDESARQPPDAAQWLAVPALLPPVTPVPLAAPAADAGAPRWQAHARNRERAPPEAHSLHHCCYRL